MQIMRNLTKHTGAAEQGWQSPCLLKLNTVEPFSKDTPEIRTPLKYKDTSVLRTLCYMLQVAMYKFHINNWVCSGCFSSGVI